MNEIQREITTAEQTIKKMEELSYGIGFQAKVKDCQEILERVKNNIKKSNNVSSFSGIYSMNNSDDIETGNSWQRAKIRESDKLLEETNRSIENSLRLGNENEEMGIGSLTRLSQDRSTLERAKDNLYVIDDNMGKSRKIIMNMTRRVATNKCILVFIMLCLLGAIGFTVWFRWIRKTTN